MRGLEVEISADFERELVASRAGSRDIAIRRGYFQAPIEMQLAASRVCHSAGSNFETRRANPAHEMVALGGDVALVEIDEDDLRFDNVLRSRLATFLCRTGNREETGAELCCPLCGIRQFLGQRIICRQELEFRAPVASAFFREQPYRNISVYISEDSSCKLRDLIAIDGGITIAHHQLPRQGASMRGERPRRYGGSR